jgi:hypothetical protein
MLDRLSGSWPQLHSGPRRRAARQQAGGGKVWVRLGTDPGDGAGHSDALKEEPQHQLGCVDVQFLAQRHIHHQLRGRGGGGALAGEGRLAGLVAAAGRRLPAAAIAAPPKTQTDSLFEGVDARLLAKGACGSSCLPPAHQGLQGVRGHGSGSTRAPWPPCCKRCSSVRSTAQKPSRQCRRRTRSSVARRPGRRAPARTLY